MIKVLWKQIYESIEFNDKEWILILYDISANHYVAIPLYSKEISGSIYLKSINKYAMLKEIKDYSRSKITRVIYKQGKPVKISDKDFNLIIAESKKEYIHFLDNNINNTSDDISYIKWCKDKLILNKNNLESNKLKQAGIYWVNMGYNVGSELRKLRPAILWRCSSDKKIWTIIPLSTKCIKDKYYFHIDLECIKEGTAKIESLMNFSYKRILAPYFSKNKLAILTKNDYKSVSNAISKYYLFN